MGDEDDLHDALLSFLHEGTPNDQNNDDRDSSLLLDSLIEDAAAPPCGSDVVLLPRARAKRQIAKSEGRPPVLPARTSSSSLASACTAMPASSGEPPVRAVAAKRGRPTPQQKVAELERQVADASKKATRLTSENAFMTERVRTLEIVIDVRESQVERMRSFQENLQAQPFEFMGLAGKEMKAVTPHEAASMFTDIFGRAALKVVPLLPVLEQHPSLIVGPVPGVEWVALRDRRVPLPEGVELGNPAGWTSLGRLPAPPDVVQDVFQLVMHVQNMQRLYLHLFFMCPQLAMVCGVHMQAVHPEEHESWKALAATISSTHQRAAAPTGAAPASLEADPPRMAPAPSNESSIPATAVPAKSDGSRPPLMAPQSHWRDVISHIRLTERQKLQAAALSDILARPLADLMRQRAEIAAALAGRDGKAAKADGASSSSPTAPALQSLAAIKSAQQLDEEEALLKQLELSLAKETTLVVLASETFFRHVLTPVQLPLIMINAYPYILDTLALIHASADEYHQRPATRPA